MFRVEGASKDCAGVKTEALLHVRKYVWVKEGKIFLKKEDKVKSIPVTHVDDFAML